jgi:hypothetical protein
VQVEYHVFDVVNFTKSFTERQRQVVIAAGSWPGFPVFTAIADSEQCANFHYAQFVREGFEGMMYRLGSCPYTVPKQEIPHGTRTGVTKSRFLSDKDNRCWHLLKRKDWQDHEFECLAAIEGEGKLAGTLGALVVLAARGKFHVGSGLTDSQRDFYWHNPPIGKMIKVKYLCLSSDGIPLNPTIHPDHEVK